ncbi:MAG: hypothetical protein FVQ81_07455 [Candidatus Glassbacteria bacterium]|nr:hypothetical protein [Candidatus Glassbacteria bacterium]
MPLEWKQKRILADDERLFIEALIARSGLINRAIMRVYLGIDINGLDRWYAYINRSRGKKRLFNLLTYWPIRVLERVSAVYVGGSLTSAEQSTFGRIARIEDYKLSRYNSAVFGAITGMLFFTGGDFTLWLSTIAGVLDTPLSLTTVLLYTMCAISVGVDTWRLIDSFARRRAHMPFGFFPLIINSTTLIKQWTELVRNRGK